METNQNHENPSKHPGILVGAGTNGKNSYTPAFRRQVIAEVKELGWGGQKIVADRYGICHTVVSTWCLTPSQKRKKIERKAALYAERHGRAKPEPSTVKYKRSVEKTAKALDDAFDNTEAINIVINKPSLAVAIHRIVSEMRRGLLEK